VILWLLLQKLQGYTRELLEAEQPHLVEQWRVLLAEEVAEQHRQAKKAQL
jgi:hypothetical protein